MSAKQIGAPPLIQALPQGVTPLSGRAKDVRAAPRADSGFAPGTGHSTACCGWLPRGALGRLGLEGP
jgi:hypothetical protein